MESVGSPTREEELSASRARITLHLHLVDGSFRPHRSSLTSMEPIEERKTSVEVELFVGNGSNSLKWLSLVAERRLRLLHKNQGRIRQRERLLGQQASFVPSSIDDHEVSTEPNEVSFDPHATIAETFKDGDHVWITFNQDYKGVITGWERRAFHLGRIHVRESGGKEEEVEEKKSDVVKKVKAPSIFRDRRFECDSKDFFDSAHTLNRAFEVEWKNHIKKPKFVSRQSSALREILRNYYPALFSIFRYYAATGMDGDPFTMQKNEMLELLSNCDIPTERFGIEWNSTNYERIKDEENSDTSLERFEFMEILCRISHDYFKDDNGGDDVKGITDLIESHILPQAWRSVPHRRYFADPNAFRRERLYTEEVNEVFVRPREADGARFTYVERLYDIYCDHAEMSQRRMNVVIRSTTIPHLQFQEFRLCLAEIDITQIYARLAFCFAQMCVVNELRRTRRKDAIDRHDEATFIEFLEALARLADLERDPDVKDPTYVFSKVLEDFVAKLIASAYKGRNKLGRVWRVDRKRYGKALNAVAQSRHAPEQDHHDMPNSTTNVAFRRKLNA
eukprot:g900.t1